MGKVWAILRQYGACIALVQLAVACSGAAPTQNGGGGAAAAVQPQIPSSPPVIGPPQPTAPSLPGNTAEAADERLVVAFGDSLYAGYNLGPDEGFAPVLERALKVQGLKARVINAGVSGDTSAAGLARLAFTLDGLPRKPDLVLVGLGGNDMLRGLDPKVTRSNLDAILAELQTRGMPAMLTGMYASRNLGADYITAFDGMYPILAKKYQVPL
ncbi:MAG: arylesterase, partial [Sphingobium sp.]